jgi:hypothetical protein
MAVAARRGAQESKELFLASLASATSGRTVSRRRCSTHYRYHPSSRWGHAKTLQSHLVSRCATDLSWRPCGAAGTPRNSPATRTTRRPRRGSPPATTRSSFRPESWSQRRASQLGTALVNGTSLPTMAVWRQVGGGCRKCCTGFVRTVWCRLARCHSKFFHPCLRLDTHARTERAGKSIRCVWCSVVRSGCGTLGRGAKTLSRKRTKKYGQDGVSLTRDLPLSPHTIAREAIFLSPWFGPTTTEKYIFLLRLWH